MMKNQRLLAAATAIALPLTTAASCGSGASSGAQATYNSIFDTPSPSRNSIVGAPVPGPDNAPTPKASGFPLIDPQSPYDCQLYLDTASGIHVERGGLLIGEVYGTCFGTGQPESVTTTLYIQWFSPRLGGKGGWVSIAQSLETLYSTPARFPAVSRYTLYTHCTPGRYRLWGKISGYDNHGVPFNPSTDPKYLVKGPDITLSQRQCDSGTT